MNWDDAKYFLAVARDGQMLGAAQRLNVSQAKLSRRIASLEAALNTKLLIRRTNGCELTEEGTALLEVTERIEAEFLDAQSKIKQTESSVSGTIRIGAPDGFGVAFLAQRLGQLATRFPNLHIQLVPVPRHFSLSQREAELAVMIGRPDKGRLRAQKLSDYSLSLYASKSYLEQAGIPTQLNDLKDHILVGYVEDLIFTPELNYNSEFLRGWASTIEVFSAMGQFETVRAGGGIGVLHDFIANEHNDLVQICPESRIISSYWTVWHESMRNAKRVTEVANFLDKIVREDRSMFLRA